MLLLVSQYLNIMTSKQRDFLSKYLTERTLNNLNRYEDVSNLIGFIIATYKDDLPLFDIRCDVHYTSTTSTVCNLREYLNNHTEQFPGPNDEAYTFDAAFTIPESDTIYYRFTQSWCKGMSNNVTRRYLTVDENCVPVNHVIEYEELAKLGIYNMSSFFKYLQRNNF